MFGCLSILAEKQMCPHGSHHCPTLNVTMVTVTTAMPQPQSPTECQTVAWFLTIWLKMQQLTIGSNWSKFTHIAPHWRDWRHVNNHQTENLETRCTSCLPLDIVLLTNDTRSKTTFIFLMECFDFIDLDWNSNPLCFIHEMLFVSLMGFFHCVFDHLFTCSPNKIPETNNGCNCMVEGWAWNVCVTRRIVCQLWFIEMFSPMWMDLTQPCEIHNKQVPAKEHANSNAMGTLHSPVRSLSHPKTVSVWFSVDPNTSKMAKATPSWVCLTMWGIMAMKIRMLIQWAMEMPTMGVNMSPCKCCVVTALKPNNNEQCWSMLTQLLPTQMPQCYLGIGGQGVPPRAMKGQAIHECLTFDL